MHFFGGRKAAAKKLFFLRVWAVGERFVPWPLALEKYLNVRLIDLGYKLGSNYMGGGPGRGGSAIFPKEAKINEKT